MGSSLYKPGKGKIWTLERVQEGFDRFYESFGRYPTAHEIDDFDYLPSSRQIQRIFGGLINLRRSLGLNVSDYTKGDMRSKNVIQMNIEGRKCENIVLKFLKEKFGDKFIHIERPVDQEFKVRYDFYVYAKPINFAIDVFRTNDIRNLIGILNIKEKKYRKGENGEDILYFVYFGDNIEKDRIVKWAQKRKIKPFKNWLIMSFEEFKKEIEKYQAYKAI